MAGVDLDVLLRAGVVFLGETEADPLNKIEKLVYFERVLKGRGQTSSEPSSEEIALARNWRGLVDGKVRSPWEIFQAALSGDRSNPPYFARAPLQSDRSGRAGSRCRRGPAQRLFDALKAGFVEIDVGAAAIDIAEGDAKEYFQKMQEIHSMQGHTGANQQSTLVALFHEMLQAGYAKWELLRAAYRHARLWRSSWPPGRGPKWARPPPEEDSHAPQLDVLPSSMAKAKLRLKELVRRFVLAADKCAALDQSQDMPEDWMPPAAVVEQPPIEQPPIEQPPIEQPPSHGEPEDDDEEEFQGCFEGAEVIVAGAEAGPEPQDIDETQRRCAYEEFHQGQGELRVAEEERAHIVEHMRALYGKYPELIHSHACQNLTRLQWCELPSDVKPRRRERRGKRDRQRLGGEKPKACKRSTDTQRVDAEPCPPSEQKLARTANSSPLAGAAESQLDPLALADDESFDEVAMALEEDLHPSSPDTNSAEEYLQVLGCELFAVENSNNLDEAARALERDLLTPRPAEAEVAVAETELDLTDTDEESVSGASIPAVAPGASKPRPP